MKSLGNNTFRTEDGRYYGRFTIAGRRTYRRLASINLRAAREEIQHLQSEHRRSAMGLCADPLTRSLTVGGLMDRYAGAGCPDVRRRRARTGAALGIERRNLDHLRPTFGPLVPAAVRIADCDRYHDIRSAQTRALFPGNPHRTGGRMVEVELTTLASVFAWAARAGLIPSNPLAGGRPRYSHSDQVRHCTACMVQTDEALHQVADRLLENPLSRTLGWQLLVEGLTGCRTREILGLRWGAERGQPGFVDDHSLWIQREKHGIFPHVLLDVVPGVSPLRDLLAALRIWHDAEHPGSPWWFPGRWDAQPVAAPALTHALHRIEVELGMGTMTSHGLRAYHVRVLRSLGVDDSEISKRLGHRSGVRLVEQTYGVPEPGWFGGRRLDFLPADRAPAWSPWTRAEVIAFPAAGGAPAETGHRGTSEGWCPGRGRGKLRSVRELTTRSVPVVRLRLDDVRLRLDDVRANCGQSGN